MYRRQPGTSGRFGDEKLPDGRGSGCPRSEMNNQGSASVWIAT
jgi:hypothetical protein